MYMWEQSNNITLTTNPERVNDGTNTDQYIS